MRAITEANDFTFKDLVIFYVLHVSSDEKFSMQLLRARKTRSFLLSLFWMIFCTTHMGCWSFRNN